MSDECEDCVPPEIRMKAYTSGQKSNGLVDSAQGRDIDGLSPNRSLGANTGGILARTSVDDSINKNLQIAISRSGILFVRSSSPGWGSGR
jgi:hypothetical protein